MMTWLPEGSQPHPDCHGPVRSRWSHTANTVSAAPRHTFAGGAVVLYRGEGPEHRATDILGSEDS